MKRGGDQCGKARSVLQEARRRIADGPPFDLRPLRYVLAAAEYMSFRQAADALNVHKSSVSRSVRDLEDQIGVALFERATSGVRLTDAGVRFIAQVLPTIQQIGSAFHTAAAAGRVEIGMVRVGIIVSIADGFMRDLLLAYSSRHPQVGIEVQDGGRRDHVRALRARQLDIAFFTGNDEITDCDTAELWQERVHVALPDTHPLAALDEVDWPLMRDEQFIVTCSEPGPEVHDYIVRRMANYSTYPRVEHKSCTQETLMSLVGIRQGITLVAAVWTSVERPGLVFRPLTAAEDIVPFSAVWSPENDNPALRRFISEAYVLAGRPRQRGSGIGEARPRSNGSRGPVHGPFS